MNNDELKNHANEIENIVKAGLQDRLHEELAKLDVCTSLLMQMYEKGHSELYDLNNIITVLSNTTDQIRSIVQPTVKRL